MQSIRSQTDGGLYCLQELPSRVNTPRATRCHRIAVVTEPMHKPSERRPTGSGGPRMLDCCRHGRAHDERIGAHLVADPSSAVRQDSRESRNNAGTCIDYRTARESILNVPLLNDYTTELVYSARQYAFCSHNISTASRQVAEGTAKRVAPFLCLCACAG